jgi:hypothetical protein
MTREIPKPQEMHFINGMTIKELKNILNVWPETNDMGEESEVWIMIGEGYSNVAKRVSLLNRSDMLIDIT